MHQRSVVFTARVVERDAQRLELSRMRMSQAELGDQLDQQRALIGKLVHEMTLMEEDLSKVQRTTITILLLLSFLLHL